MFLVYDVSHICFFTDLFACMVWSRSTKMVKWLATFGEQTMPFTWTIQYVMGESSIRLWFLMQGNTQGWNWKCTRNLQFHIERYQRREFGIHLFFVMVYLLSMYHLCTLSPILPIKNQQKKHARLWRDNATFLPQLRASSPRRKSHEQMAVWRKLPNRGAWPIVPGKSSPEVTFWLQKPADTGALWWGGSLVQCTERAVKLYNLGRHDTVFLLYPPDHCELKTEGFSWEQ